MILELVLALGLAQGDSSLVGPSALTLDAHAVDDTYASWREVLDARAPANAAGFGSVALGNADGTYTLRYVFKGSLETVQSQLNRLNVLLDKNLVLYVPPTSPLEQKGGTSGKPSKRNDQTLINAPAQPSTETRHSAPLEVQHNPALSAEGMLTQAPVQAQEPRDFPEENVPIESPSEVQESQRQISTLKAPLDPVASPPKVSVLVKKAVPAELESPTVRDESLEVPFAIVFGSYEVKANAERKKAALIRAGQPAVVLQNGGYYRVGLVYDSYPGKELREFKNQGKVCWLLRRD